RWRRRPLSARGAARARRPLRDPRPRSVEAPLWRGWPDDSELPVPLHAALDRATVSPRGTAVVCSSSYSCHSPAPSEGRGPVAWSFAGTETIGAFGRNDSGFVE